MGVDSRRADVCGCRWQWVLEAQGPITGHAGARKEAEAGEGSKVKGDATQDRLRCSVPLQERTPPNLRVRASLPHYVTDTGHLLGTRACGCPAIP